MDLSYFNAKRTDIIAIVIICGFWQSPKNKKKTWQTAYFNIYYCKCSRLYRYIEIFYGIPEFQGGDIIQPSFELDEYANWLTRLVDSSNSAHPACEQFIQDIIDNDILI